MELQDSERVILKKMANLFKGIEGVGGMMTITNKRVIFQPHSLNIQSGAVEFPLDEIISVMKRNSGFIVPNGVKIRMKSGKEYKFVLWKREEVIKTIQELCLTPKDESSIPV